MATNKKSKIMSTHIREIEDYSKLSNEEMKNYIRDIELQKEKQTLLKNRLDEEDTKIDVLNKNIYKLDSVNASLEEEGTKIRDSSITLYGQIEELKMSLEKAQAESQFKRVKGLKENILINARILKDQEDSIKRLREKKEYIRKEQEAQRNRLIEKRQKIEKLKNETIKNEFENMDHGLMEAIEDTIKNNSNKSQIVSSALSEVATEMKRIKALDVLNSAKTNDNIEILKTQMIDLNSINQESDSTNEKIKNLEEKEKQSNIERQNSLEQVNIDNQNQGQYSQGNNTFNDSNNGIIVKRKSPKEFKEREPFVWSKFRISVLIFLILLQIAIIVVIVLFYQGILTL